MKILYISLSDPRSINHGGEQRYHFVWEGLKKTGDVYTIVPVHRYGDERCDEQAKIYWVCLEKRCSPFLVIERLVNRLLPAFPVPAAYSLKRVWRFGVPKPDVCVVRPASLAMSLCLWKLAPTCVDMDDIPLAEFDIETRECGNSFIRRLRRMVLKYVQDAVCRKASRVWIADEEEFKRFPGIPVSFVPNIPVPPLPDFADEVGSTDTLFFIGYLAHSPNQVALNWFLSTMWRELKKEFPELKFEICGGGLPETLKQSWASYPDVKLRGFVKDLRPCYQRALAILTPMRIGSGTCLKVLEALRMGRVLLATQQGLRGIRREYRNAANGILPFEDLPSLVDVIKILRSADRVALQRAAVDFVQLRNTQKFIDKVVEVDVKSVLGEVGVAGCVGASVVG